MASDAVCITGISGFIGSHLAKRLHRVGKRVIGIDRQPLNANTRPYVDHFVRADILDVQTILESLSAEAEFSLVHAAALIEVGASVHMPSTYFDNNYTRPKHLFQALHQARKLTSILFSSTAATYGSPKADLITETHSTVPINPYGESKLLLERWLVSFSEKTQIPVGIFRYFNAAGADPDGELGEDHEPETHLIPNLIFAALQPGKHVTLFGQDFPTHDGSCVRDYIHVSDLAAAHALLLEKMDASKEGGIFNLGTSRGYSVKDVFSKVQDVLGMPVAHQWGPRRDGDPARLVASGEKARKILEWEPKHSSLTNIIETAARYYRQQKRFSIAD